MITNAQLAMFERDGLVTIDGPFTPDQVRAARDSIERAFDGKPELFTSVGFATPEVLALMLHDGVIETAKRMLRSEEVVLRAYALRKTAAKPEKTAALEGEHADIRYSAADLDATPRRILCTILIWLTEVTPRRAPFMFRPGSHRQLAALHDGPPVVAAHSIDKLSHLTFADPVPAIVPRAGMLSVGSTGVMHSGSVNTDTQPRIVLFTQFQDEGVPDVVIPQSTLDSMRPFYDQAVKILPPDKARLIRLDPVRA